MTILSNDFLIFYLGYNSLSIYGIGFAQPKVFIFPSAVVAHQEILDKIAFDKLLRGFLEPFKKNKAVIVLSGDIVYSTLIDATDQKALHEKEKEFEELIPIETEKVTMKVIDRGKQFICLGVNREFYSCVIAAGLPLGITIRAVEALNVYTNTVTAQSLSYSFFINLFTDHILFDKANFLLKNALDNSFEHLTIVTPSVGTADPSLSDKSDSKIPLVQYIIFGFFLLFLLSTLVFAFLHK